MPEAIFPVCERREPLPVRAERRRAIVTRKLPGHPTSRYLPDPNAVFAAVPGTGRQPAAIGTQGNVPHRRMRPQGISLRWIVDVLHADDLFARLAERQPPAVVTPTAKCSPFMHRVACKPLCGFEARGPVRRWSQAPALNAGRSRNQQLVSQRVKPGVRASGGLTKHFVPVVTGPETDIARSSRDKPA